MPGESLHGELIKKEGARATFINEDEVSVKKFSILGEGGVSKKN